MNLTLRTRLAAFAVGVAILGACSDQVGPVAPDGGPQLARKLPSSGTTDGGSPTYASNTVVVTSLTRNKPLETEIVAQMVATPDSGGYLWIEEAGLIVYVPPGAVSRTITITAKALAGSSVAYEFGPHGTEFLKPVYIWQDLRPTTWRLLYERTRKMEAGYFKNRNQLDESSGTAYVDELIPLTSQTNKNNALFTVNHFSGYLLSISRK